VRVCLKESLDSFFWPLKACECGFSVVIASKLTNTRARTDPHLHRDKGKSVAQNLQDSRWGRMPDKTVIDVDEIETISDLPTNTQSIEKELFRPACQGYVLQFPDGQSPHSAYPFGLHDLRTLPWDYAVHNGVMTLYARGCSSSVGTNSVSGRCEECKRLEKNPSLEGIRTRLKDGVHENASYAYHGIGGHHQLLHQKDASIKFYHLRRLNQEKTPLGKVTALSDYKRFMVAIASGKVERVDRVLQ